MDRAVCKGRPIRHNQLMQKTKHGTAFMKRYFPTLLCGLAFLMAGLRPAPAQTQLSPTRYDYSQVAQQITQGCTTDYDRAKAIYRWLCANISYDTSYSIYTADDCWDRKRGGLPSLLRTLLPTGGAAGHTHRNHLRKLQEQGRDNRPGRPLLDIRRHQPGAQPGHPD